ncbi:MAG: PAS domain S-box protein [Proteobacteria bacterium]|nr:PAS domain S-box protein [Pseudomonadota bacterium]MBU1581785.1 PAS domain S-box protein [Pseudomonadota bacterium]MBU2627998.1 PAS domain S-box protein [Pseudomonadota bacterium]
MNLKTNYLVMAVLLLIILILVGITYNSTRIITERTVENHQQSIAADAAKTVELWLSQHLSIVEAAAGAVQQIPMGQTPETLRILKMAMKAGNFSDVYIGLKDGTMIDGADWIPPKGYDPRNRPWYKKALADNKITFTTPYIDLTTTKLVIAIVKPLVIKNEFKGVISADIILDTLEQNVMNVKIGTSGYTFIIDSLGTVLVHPDQELLMTAKIQETNQSLSGILEYFKTSGSGSYYYNYLGEEKILSFQRLPETGWYLCTTVQKKEAYTLAKNTAMLFAMGMVFKILGILAILLLMVIGVSALILIISKHRYESIVKQQKQLLSGKDRDLKGEITRRKEIETRYQTLFNVATNAIMLSKNFAFIECNEKAVHMFGQPHEKIIGKSMLDLSPAIQQDGRESKKKFDQIIENLVAGDQQIFEWAFNRSDGTEFPAEVGLKTLRLDSEMVTLYSIWDISKRADAEHQLRQAQKLAAMGEMLSAIAHQWRQPLNALSTYIASLPSAFYNQMITKEFIEKMVKESDSQIQFMSRTINDFRQYFRPSKTKQTFEVQDTVRSAVKLINPQLKQNAITLQINEVLDAKELFVFGYKNEFVHVLVNIISNAKDAILEQQEKTRNIEIPRRIDIYVEKQNNTVVLKIKDTGCGIPDLSLTKIFTPYFTTKGIATGTGIGLYMAKMIVEKEMQGQISVENMSDGARFIISLPLSDLKGNTG